MSQPPDTWASEMQALQDQIERLTLELEVCRHDESNAQYWAGQDDGRIGVATRWEEALSAPIPKGGMMQEPLESLYRRTEVLRLDLAAAISDIALVRGQRDGLSMLLMAVFDDIALHWKPHNKESRLVLRRLGDAVLAAREAMEAGGGTP